MKTKLLIVLSVLICFAGFIFAQSEVAAVETTVSEPSVEENAEVKSSGVDTQALKYFAAAVAVGIACIAGGLAVGKIGAAAMGAMSENSELSGKALPFAGLAEGICLWGFLVALLILMV